MQTPTPPMRELPYYPDSSRLFESLAERPWAIFLDSGRPMIDRGRYDLLACEPMETLVTRGDVTEIRERERLVRRSTEAPLQLVRQTLAKYPHSGSQQLPFCGGAMGYFAYDLARRLEQLPVIAADTDQLPEMAVGIYDWALLVDHQERRSWLVGGLHDPAAATRWIRRLEAICAGRAPAALKPFTVCGEIESNLSRTRYAEAFQRVQQLIRAGDCYQVNLAQRFTVATKGAPWLAYRKLRELNPAPFGAYLNTPFSQILSSSPECFLTLREGTVETRPIKGTVPRGGTEQEDRQLRELLRQSPKDQAENLMIVDLLRNDLSKSCRLGSVTVDQLFAVESYATVHHLVSTIRARLASDKDAIDLLRGSFPGGSITGAPKLRAMEIIESLEPDRRGIYCGAIGYIGFNGNMDTNIAIRTMLHIGGRMRFWAGGGLVADSVLEPEYQETYHKARAMLQLLQQDAAPVQESVCP